MIGHRRTPNPTHTQHMLCTTATAPVTVCSWAVTGQGPGKQSPHLACGTPTWTPTRTQSQSQSQSQAPITVCVRVLLDSLADLRASPVAQQLSICHVYHVCQPQDGLITIPAGPGDHKNQQTIGDSRLEYRRGRRPSNTLQVTGPAGVPSLQARHASISPSTEYTWTYVYLTCCTVAPAISRHLVRVDVPTAGPCAVVGPGLLSHC